MAPTGHTSLQATLTHFMQSTGKEKIFASSSILTTRILDLVGFTSPQLVTAHAISQIRHPVHFA
jgi:hypothetical protein